ncbi:MAG: universal stress protein [Bacteriovorax sp.]|nr:universal stress protein [Bacteriovorax sp.]
MKSIVICASLNPETHNTLKSITSKIDLQHAQVFIVHVFEIQFATTEITAMAYPSADQYPEIEKSIMQTLDKIATSLALPEKTLVIKKCIFSHSREAALKDYLKEVNAEMVVVATRGKHGIAGLFSSSMTDFLCKYSPCDVLVLRPQH